MAFYGISQPRAPILRPVGHQPMYQCIIVVLATCTAQDHTVTARWSRMSLVTSPSGGERYAWSVSTADTYGIGRSLSPLIVLQTCYNPLTSNSQTSSGNVLHFCDKRRLASDISGLVLGEGES